MLLRGFAMLFSMILVGVYIYNRSGGRLFPRQASDDAPAAQGLGLSDDVRFGGSKSAAVFDPSGIPETPITPIATGSSGTQLLPGSKSLVLAPAETPTVPMPAANNPAPQPPAKQELLPGSKSDVPLFNGQQTVAPNR
jgi:hypothetical protein